MIAVLVAILILGRLAGSLWLSALNRSEVSRHADAPPPAAAAVMDGPTYSKAVAYTLARSLFGGVTEVFDAVVLAAAVLTGALPALYRGVSGWGSPGSAWAGALFVVICGVLLSLLSLPFDAWEQFRIESRFGFNRTSPGLWAADKAKGLGLGLALGFPVVWALLALVGWVGPLWWVWGAVLVTAVQLVMIVLYPMLILPLFNRLEPLPEGELRARLMALGEKTGFRAASIQVMDGSKRSGHSNAFFTGFGRFRRIVLFDTLVAQLSPLELEAVLAHEIGHYRCGHIPKRLALSTAGLFACLAAVAALAGSAWFNPAFGYPAGAAAPALLLCGLLGGLVTFWLSPLFNGLSRRHEYEADAFARDALGGPEGMVGALRKLAEKNLTNLTPHPWFSAFHYSHPTPFERERALTAAR